MKHFLQKTRFVWFWGYLSFLTYELLLKNPWVILGDKIAADPPMDTSSVLASAVLHLTAFSVLGFLASFAFCERSESSRVRYSLWLVAYCGVTEILQFYVPNRWPSGEDVLFNVIGLIVGAILFYQPFRASSDIEEPSADLLSPST